MSVGLKGLVFFVVTGVIGQDGGACDHILVNGVIFGVFIPKERAVILVRRDELMSNDVDKRNTHHAPDASQGSHNLLDSVCTGEFPARKSKKSLFGSTYATKIVRAGRADWAFSQLPP
jgi:hypothetical protein